MVSVRFSIWDHAYYRMLDKYGAGQPMDKDMARYIFENLPYATREQVDQLKEMYGNYGRKRISVWMDDDTHERYIDFCYGLSVKDRGSLMSIGILMQPDIYWK